jgi:hypothetical protein
LVPFLLLGPGLIDPFFALNALELHLVLVFGSAGLSFFAVGVDLCLPLEPDFL